jgi:sulfatase modifying factor 1
MRALAVLLAGTTCASPPVAERAPARDLPEPSAPIVSAPVVSAEPPPAPPPPTYCPNDMVLVDGEFCPRLTQRCLARRKRRQCAEFEASQCEGPTQPKRYCIDRYEYPNVAGSIPTVMNSWRESKATCESLGKRLCTDAEWTLACEGPERLGFPYGLTRDATACPIDKPSPRVNEARLFWSATQEAEIARLDQREPSGSRPRCQSAYGVFDLTGNVDEWVVNESGRPYQSALKGGNWGEYRNACRPATLGHDEGFEYYQTGFRCCRAADPP